MAPGFSENMIAPIGHVHYNDVTTCVKRSRPASRKNKKKIVKILSLSSMAFSCLEEKIKKVLVGGCGACGRRYVRWGTRRVIHGKHAVMQRISSINP